MQNHAFVIEADAQDGIGVAQAWAKKELGMKAENNPDVVVLLYGLLSVEDARRVSELAASAPFAGEHKVVIISAGRAYHEAQNALLKLFEEPPRGTYLFLVLPSLGSLLPTLRSRVQVLKHQISARTLQRDNIDKINSAEEFLRANKEQRSAIIKKILSHHTGNAVSAREQAIAILNGIEANVYAKRGDTLWFPQGVTLLLQDIATLRGHLHDRSAPIRMILEHLSIVIPKNLL